MLFLPDILISALSLNNNPHTQKGLRKEFIIFNNFYYHHPNFNSNPNYNKNTPVILKSECMLGLEFTINLFYKVNISICI